MTEQYKDFLKIVDLIYYGSLMFDLVKKDHSQCFKQYCIKYNIEYNSKYIYDLISINYKNKLTEQIVKQIYNRINLKQKIKFILNN